jgi:hypothetical protein
VRNAPGTRKARSSQVCPAEIRRFGVPSPREAGPSVVSLLA